MWYWLENLIIRWWNRHQSRHTAPHPNDSGLDIGTRVVDGELSRHHVAIEHRRRAESLAILGKTGSGKSSLIRHLAEQDVRAGRSFVFFDLHGDGGDFVLKMIADRERVLKTDLSDRLIVIDPTDSEYSVGWNPFEGETGEDRFVRIAEFAEILKQRWHLDSFGARTDELLRNVLLVIAENGLTLIEIALVLRDAGFRSRCLTKVTNPEVKQYFELRYDPVSDAMRAVMSEPILNKISFFVSDPRFRHLLGQRRSTFSVLDAMDRECWIVLMIPKGRLGEHAATFGSLFLAVIRHALYARTSRALCTLYCDEIQNLVTFGDGLETILSEARKFGVGVVSANQFLDQFTAEMRSAILAVGSLACFQLSGPDAHQIAGVLDGGKPLAAHLRNLPRRHLILKTVHEHWLEAVVPVIHEPPTDPNDLYRRSRARWARCRSEIEDEILQRQSVISARSREVLHDWE